MTTDAIVRVLRYRWLIFWILALSYILVFFHRLCPAVVAVDIMRDLNAGGALVGFLSSAYFYPYAAMQIPAGLLADSWGPRNSITLFFGFAFIGSLILGVAPTVSWAIVGRTLVGVGVATLFVHTMKILAEWFRPEEFASMTGILMAMGGVGSLAAATPLAWLSDMIGWRYSFVSVGILTLILAVFIWLFVRDRPSDMGWPPLIESPSENQPAIGLGKSIRIVLSSPWFWLMGVWFFTNCGAYFSFAGLWGGPYFMHVYGLSKTESGKVLSMIAIGMVIGSPLVGYLSNRIFKARKPVLILSNFVLLGLTGLLTFFTDRMTVPGLYLFCLVMGMFPSAIVVIGFTMNKELFPVSIAGTATGLVNLFPFVGGAVLQPTIGYILEYYGKTGDQFTLEGYRSAFWMLFFCGIVALFSSFFMKETLKKS